MSSRPVWLRHYGCWKQQWQRILFVCKRCAKLLSVPRDLMSHRTAKTIVPVKRLRYALGVRQAVTKSHRVSPRQHAWLTRSEIMARGTLKLDLDPQPSAWGEARNHLRLSLVPEISCGESPGISLSKSKSTQWSFPAFAGPLYPLQWGHRETD
jgi:hypothetical protein